MRKYSRKRAVFGLAVILMVALAGCGSEPESTGEKNVKASSVMMSDTYDVRDTALNDFWVLGSEINRDSIVSVTFLDTLKDMPNSAWDVSENQDGSVMAWTKGVMGKRYKLFIGAEGGVAVKDCRGLFAAYVNVKEINFNHCFDTSQAVNMKEMFWSCDKLKKIDVSGFDTSQVTDMSRMFLGVDEIEQLDVSGFDTSQVTDMSNMFSGCENITQLDLSSFDTSQVADMHNMFYGCGSLTQLDLSSFNTNQIENMEDMFANCGITAEEAGLQTN